MDERIKILVNTLGALRVKEDVDITDQLDSRLGGVVRAFYIATTTAELTQAVHLAQDLRIEYLVIGAGSKVAIAKSGFPGLMIKNRSDNIKLFGIKGKVDKSGLGVEEASIEVDSGVSLNRLGNYAKQQKLKGVETVCDLTGTVGGNLYINPELKRISNQIKVLTKTRTPDIKTSDQVKREDIIISVVVRLKSA